MTDVMKSAREVFDCAGENDVIGKMAAAGLAGAVLGGSSPVSPVTSLGFGVLGALIGSLPTLANCTQMVAIDQYPAPVPTVNGPKTAAPTR